MEFCYFLWIKESLDLLCGESPSPHCSSVLTFLDGNQIWGFSVEFDCSNLASLYILLSLATKNIGVIFGPLTSVASQHGDFGPQTGNTGCQCTSGLEKIPVSLYRLVYISIDRAEGIFFFICIAAQCPGEYSKHMREVRIAMIFLHDSFRE